MIGSFIRMLDLVSTLQIGYNLGLNNNVTNWLRTIQPFLAKVTE